MREDAILDAANQLLLEQGYADMNMDDVAARTGMSKATVYQFFDSKQELALAVVRRNLRNGLALFDGSSRFGQPSERLEDGFRRAVASRVPLGAGRLGLPPALVRDDPTIGQLRDALRASLVEAVEAAKRAGEYAPDLDGEVVFAILQGLSQADLHEAADVAIATVCRGFRAPVTGRKKDRKKK